MRLKSSFKDYYDGCLSLDMESEPLYIRRTEKKPTNYHIGSIGTGYGSINLGLSIRPFVIGLGTVVYPGLKVNKEFGTTVFCYSTEDLRKFIGKNFRKREAEEFDSRTTRRGVWGYGKFSQRVDEFFTPRSPCLPYKNISTALMPIWAVMAAPSLWSRINDRLWSNIRLASFDFARIMPPYQAYQELRTYLCNQAAPREYIPPISDADMLEAKGFDLKTSFRSVAPGGPARKRRKRQRKGGQK